MSESLRVRPVGLRAVSGPRAGRLTWATPGGLELAIGARALVRDGDATWLGEVIVPTDTLYEVAPLDTLPAVQRRVSAADPWPEPTPTAGARLLESLGLPSTVTRRP